MTVTWNTSPFTFIFTPPKYLSATSRTFSSPIPCSVIIPGNILCFVVIGTKFLPICTGTSPSKLFSTAGNKNCFFRFRVRRIKPFPGSCQPFDVRHVVFHLVPHFNIAAMPSLFPFFSLKTALPAPCRPDLRRSRPALYPEIQGHIPYRPRGTHRQRHIPRCCIPCPVLLCAKQGKTLYFFIITHRNFYRFCHLQYSTNLSEK